MTITHVGEELTMPSIDLIDIPEELANPCGPNAGATLKEATSSLFDFSVGCVSEEVPDVGFELSLSLEETLKDKECRARDC